MLNSKTTDSGILCTAQLLRKSGRSSTKNRNVKKTDRQLNRQKNEKQTTLKRKVKGSEA
jgi:hypothetical protein